MPFGVARQAPAAPGRAVVGDELLDAESSGFVLVPFCPGAALVSGVGRAERGRGARRAPGVDAGLEAGFPHRFVSPRLPERSDLVDLDGTVLTIVQLPNLLGETAVLDSACRQDDVRMMIARVAAAVRPMDGPGGHGVVALGQIGGEAFG